jgi:hypothetical protein
LNDGCGKTLHQGLPNQGFTANMADRLDGEYDCGAALAINNKSSESTCIGCGELELDSY